MAASGAAKEIRHQLQRQGGFGQVWIEGWGQNYEAELGSLRDFISSRREFQVVPEGRKRFSVMLRGEGASKGGKGKGGHGLPALANAPARRDRDGGGRRGGWSQTAGLVIREIRSQLEAQGGKGKVWIPRWSELEPELGTLRDFVASKPDKFKVIPGAGMSFTVALTGGGWGSGGKQPGPSNYQSKTCGWDPVVAEAITEIRQQLQAQGGEGEVWVDSWKERFGALGSLRDFLDSRPDKFTVIPGVGNRFTVALGRGAPAEKYVLPLKRRAELTPARTSKRVKVEDASDDEDLEAQLMAEISEQLDESGASGRVWVRAWNSRYKPTFGSLRDFLDSHPESFKVRGGGGERFTVSLA